MARGVPIMPNILHLGLFFRAFPFLAPPQLLSFLPSLFPYLHLPRHCKLHQFEVGDALQVTANNNVKDISPVDITNVRQNAQLDDSHHTHGWECIRHVNSINNTRIAYPDIRI